MLNVSYHGYDIFLLLISLKTVPSGVSLTPAIDPRALKHANVTLNVDWSGQMTLSGYFRVCSFFPDKFMIFYSPWLVYRGRRITPRA